VAAPFWLNAVLRSLVWLGAVAFLAYLKKPDGASIATVRGDLIGWLGGAFLAVGLALHLWSNVTLARGERAASQGAAKLVTDGPYAFVRHPIYLSGVPLLLGTCLLYSQVTGLDLVAGLVLLAFFHLRVVRGEEPTLRRQFGQSYEEYCRRVPRWIPRVWRRFS
jgi:protein-S-isoprenylcysteine O-methyltransferase Ste14